LMTFTSHPMWLAKSVCDMARGFRNSSLRISPGVPSASLRANSLVATIAVRATSALVRGTLGAVVRKTSEQRGSELLERELGVLDHRVGNRHA